MIEREDDDGCTDDLEEVAASLDSSETGVARSMGSGTGKDFRCRAQKILTEGASHCGIEQGIGRVG